MNSRPIRVVRPNWAIRLAQQWEFPHKLGICDRLFGRSLSRHGVCWVQTAAGLTWKLDLRSSTHRWIVYGKYEGRPFLDWAKRFLPRDGIVVDSGANIGQMLLYLAQWVPDGKVFAFEPGEVAAEWLRDCLEVNRHLPVKLIRCGLGSGDSEMSLVPVGDPETHGACNQIRPAGEGPNIRVRRLTDVLRGRGIDHVDLWKLDVEGFESEAIAGAKELLQERRISAIYAELGFGRGDQVRRELEAFGYRCHLFAEAGNLYVPGSLPGHINGLFLPK